MLQMDCLVLCDSAIQPLLVWFGLWEFVCVALCPFLRENKHKGILTAK